MTKKRIERKVAKADPPTPVATRRKTWFKKCAGDEFLETPDEEVRGRRPRIGSTDPAKTRLISHNDHGRVEFVGEDRRGRRPRVQARIAGAQRAPPPVPIGLRIGDGTASGVFTENALNIVPCGDDVQRARSSSPIPIGLRIEGGTPSCDFTGKELSASRQSKLCTLIITRVSNDNRGNGGPSDASVASSGGSSGGKMLKALHVENPSNASGGKRLKALRVVNLSAGASGGKMLKAPSVHNPSGAFGGKVLKARSVDSPTGASGSGGKKRIMGVEEPSGPIGGKKLSVEDPSGGFRRNTRKAQDVEEPSGPCRKRMRNAPSLEVREPARAVSSDPKVRSNSNIYEGGDFGFELAPCAQKPNQEGVTYTHDEQENLGLAAVAPQGKKPLRFEALRVAARQTRSLARESALKLAALTNSLEAQGGCKEKTSRLAALTNSSEAHCGCKEKTPRLAAPANSRGAHCGCVEKTAQGAQPQGKSLRSGTRVAVPLVAHGIPEAKPTRSLATESALKLAALTYSLEAHCEGNDKTLRLAAPTNSREAHCGCIEKTAQGARIPQAKSLRSGTRVAAPRVAHGVPEAKPMRTRAQTNARNFKVRGGSKKKVTQQRRGRSASRKQKKRGAREREQVPDADENENWDWMRANPAVRARKRQELERPARDIDEFSNSNHAYQEENDSHCRTCNRMGTLILCDNCFSSFHPPCVGLKSPPKEPYWFCHRCRCLKCGQRHPEFDSTDAKQYSIICCALCDRRYHVGCVRARISLLFAEHCKDQADNPGGDIEPQVFTCDDTCKDAYHGTRRIIGTETPILRTEEPASFIVLRSGFKVSKFDAYKRPPEVLKNKLREAYSVLTSQFEDYKDDRSGKEVLRRMVCSKPSKADHLDFSNFFTMTVTVGGKVASMAIFRGRGEGFAEVDYVATADNKQGQGWGRQLMRALQRLLRYRGFHTLVLPSLPSKVGMWTSRRFGFKEMKEKDIVSLVELDFMSMRTSTWVWRSILPHRPSKWEEECRKKLAKRKSSKKSSKESSKKSRRKSRKKSRQKRKVRRNEASSSRRFRAPLPRRRRDPRKGKEIIVMPPPTELEAVLAAQQLQLEIMPPGAPSPQAVGFGDQIMQPAENDDHHHDGLPHRRNDEIVAMKMPDFMVLDSAAAVQAVRRNEPAAQKAAHDGGADTRTSAWTANNVKADTRMVIALTAQDGGADTRMVVVPAAEDGGADARMVIAPTAEDGGTVTQMVVAPAAHNGEADTRMMDIPSAEDGGTDTRMVIDPAAQNGGVHAGIVTSTQPVAQPTLPVSYGAQIVLGNPRQAPGPTAIHANASHQKPANGLVSTATRCYGGSQKMKEQKPEQQHQHPLQPQSHPRGQQHVVPQDAWAELSIPEILRLLRGTPPSGRSAQLSRNARAVVIRDNVPPVPARQQRRCRSQNVGSQFTVAGTVARPLPLKLLPSGPSFSGRSTTRRRFLERSPLRLLPPVPIPSMSGPSTTAH